MHFLVTGGAGFIGSHMVDALVERGDHVTVLDDFSYGKEENLAAVRSAIRLERGSVTDLETVARVMRGVDVVLHQAAIASVPRSVEEPQWTTDVNLTGTLNVLLAARDAGVKRVVLASSSAVYGDTGHTPNKEDRPLNPRSPYAIHKWAGEVYATLFGKLYGLETVALRYFNVYGPRQDASSPYSGVISLFAEKMSRHERPTVYGDGTQTRDFIYVEDVVAANLRAATLAPAPPPVINVGTGHSVSLNELIKTLNKIHHTRLEPEHVPARPGDIVHSMCDNARMTEALGITPRFTLEEGLRALVDSLKKQSP